MTSPGRFFRRGLCVESPSGVLILVGYHQLVAVYLHLCVVPMSNGSYLEGCRKMARPEWVELLRRAFHEIGITAEFATMPRMYARRMDL